MMSFSIKKRETNMTNTEWKDFKEEVEVAKEWMIFSVCSVE
jgi:hypothetical protein